MKFGPKVLGFTPTSSEIQYAREVWANTPSVTVKKLLSQFSIECPDCGATRPYWKIVPPIKCSGEYHFVTYQCQKCQAVFKKIEENEG